MTGTGPVHVRRVTTRAELESCWAVRLEVFVAEQGVPVEEEVDDLDTAPTTSHVLATRADGHAVGTGRLLSDPAHPGEVHLGRLAVRADARGRGLGARLVVALEGLALADHGLGSHAGAATGANTLSVTVVLAAQEHAIGFYERLGYELVPGERFLDAGIWHRDMAHRITS
ncbi:GNAT family N-acetyltransferase [Georgenia sp. 10Sc9-8]|uniref:GNAT family N-acetyltransferase n=1 Tax=Georgenia halotolerans TaxID=3028317 RepID=A0ABT5TYP4_9MICO|nr:GNAT family N-acetyltransferase [Georgenia halotolerans]